MAKAARKPKGATPTDDSFTGDPPPPAADPAPVAEVEPPAADPLADEAAPSFAIPDDVKGTLRGLYANGRELAAFRLYRETFVAAGLTEPTLAESKRAVEELAGEAPPPADFALPVDAGPEQPYIPTPAESEPSPAPAEVEPPRGRVVLGEKTIDHAFVLVDDEFAALAHHLAALEDEILAEETTQASERKRMKERLAALTNDRAKTAAIVRDRREVRQVYVYEEADHDAGIVRVIVKSTGQVLTERPLARSESQVPLFGRIAAPPPVAPPVDGDGWPDGDGETLAHDERAEEEDDEEPNDAERDRDPSDLAGDDDLDATDGDDEDAA